MTESPDNEIDKDVLCKHTVDTTLGIYSTRFLDCEDSDKKKEIDSRNIYNTDITEEDLKEYLAKYKSQIPPINTWTR